MFDLSILKLEIGLCPINLIFALAGLLISLAFVSKSTNPNQRLSFSPLLFLRVVSFKCPALVLVILTSSIQRIGRSREESDCK